ncbi:nonstructural protein [robinz microvirus RP_120]|nr:nonstructural protein [robinz microvirus RP_120]
MIYRMFAVLDKKINAYNTPLFYRSKGEAIRSFSDACLKEDNFKAHAEDFVWCYLGTYDDETGKGEWCHVPEIVITALDVVVTSDL